MKLMIPTGTKKRGTFLHSTKNISYIFNFDSFTIETVKDGTVIKFSKCVLKGLADVYKNIIDKFDQSDQSNQDYQLSKYYVVCPVYTSKSTKNILDTQLSVTGKSKIKEPDHLAVIREVQEELGISVNPMKIEHCYFSRGSYYDNNQNRKKYKKYITESSYCVDISDSHPFNPKLDVVFKNDDDKLRKIQVVLYGKLENILNLYSKIFNRPDSNDIESIRFVRIISLEEFI